MNISLFTRRSLFALAILLLAQCPGLQAQTDEDAIMMTKNNFCVGATYTHSSWKDYWEGTLHRNNLNLGTVTTQMFGLMGNYGISRKLNIIVNAPYVETKASAGTLHGMHGIQDLSAWIKWLAFEQNIGKGVLSLYALGGASLPLTNYIADYLPLSIGLHSKTLSGRIMADYQLGNFFATASGTYTWRSNITIPQDAYYTTEEHLTNKVWMPNMTSINFRTGYRSERWILEAVASDMITLGGFDIRRNDMPFPSNKMNAIMVGGNFKYTFKAVDGLSLTGGGNYTVAGRNVGQSTTLDIGVFYILDFSHKAKTKATTQKTK
jgi:Putative MetA-pathway of phenol degradation